MDWTVERVRQTRPLMTSFTVQVVTPVRRKPTPTITVLMVPLKYAIQLWVLKCSRMRLRVIPVVAAGRVGFIGCGMAVTATRRDGLNN